MIHLSLGDILKFFNYALYCFVAYFGVRILYEVLTWLLIPNARTSPRIRRRIIAKLKSDQAVRQKNPYTVIDLGSGNGHLTRAIARAMPQARVIGLELRPNGLFQARLRQRLMGPKNVEYQRQDFFARDLSDADAVTMFLAARIMPALGDKLANDLRPGSLVLSNTFPLDAKWQPKEIIKAPSLFYFGDKLFVYRV